MDELKTTPQTSILIVNRNRSDALRRTLRSLEGSVDPKLIEVIVVDNASTDGSATADAEFPFVRMLRMQRNFGHTKAVNVGTRTATGDYLCLTPPGVEFAPETIPKLLTALAADPGSLAIAPLVVDEADKAVSRVYRLPSRETFASFWKSGDLGPPVTLDTSTTEIAAEYLVDSPILLRRQSIVAMNYLDERYGQFWSDAEICFQVKRAGKSIRLLPGIRVKGEPGPRMIGGVIDRQSAQMSADAAIGAAGYLGKHQGFMTGVLFRMQAAASALLSAVGGTLIFREPGPRWARFFALASGQKIDGNQA